MDSRFRGNDRAHSRAPLQKKNGKKNLAPMIGHSIVCALTESVIICVNLRNLRFRVFFFVSSCLCGCLWRLSLSSLACHTFCDASPPDCIQFQHNFLSG